MPSEWGSVLVRIAQLAPDLQATRKESTRAEPPNAPRPAANRTVGVRFPIRRSLNLANYDAVRVIGSNCDKMCILYAPCANSLPAMDYMYILYAKTVGMRVTVFRGTRL